MKRLLTPFDIVADDAAAVERSEDFELVATASMFEGVDFDLQWMPLEHLGFKAVTAAISNIAAMNGTARRISVALGLSARFSVEEVESLYVGVKHACQSYKVSLIGGNTSASMTGLTIVVTAQGDVLKDKICRRAGAVETDLVCATGNLGAAYMGMQLLEREKRAVGTSGATPKLEGFNYLLKSQLKPQARVDIIEDLEKAAIVPTAMTDISGGLASAALNLCEGSQCGVRLYLQRIPIASEVFSLAEELGIDPVVAALNGGDDYELLFTVPLSRHKEVLSMPGVDVIGHIVALDKGAALTTPDGSEIPLQSPDYTTQF